MIYLKHVPSLADSGIQNLFWSDGILLNIENSAAMACGLGLRPYEGVVKDRCSIHQLVELAVTSKYKTEEAYCRGM
jgi:hypothetical protein